MKYKFSNPVLATTGTEKYQVTIEWRNGKFISDEPVTNGGKDTGPDPYTLLLSSLASCTLITLRMYIDRKGWDISSISIKLNLYQETKNEKTNTVIDKDISFISPVDDEQRIRLQEISRNCPISMLLENEIKVRSFVFRDQETKTINYANEKVTVVWRPELCQHSTRCWTQLPEVFNPKIKKWIDPDGAAPEIIEQQVRRCPSGALGFFINEKKE